MTGDLVARGRTIIASGRYAPPRGKYLGRLEFWGLDVYEGSPQAWIDALLAEAEQEAEHVSE